MPQLRETVASDPDVVRLAGLLREELRERYGADVVDPPPDPSSPAVVLEADGMAIGCAVVSREGDDHLLRSMFVEPAHRGAGLSHRLLSAIEDLARRRGVRTLGLLTGTRQPEAMALYARSGYTPVDCHDDWPETRCFEKQLSP